MPGLGPSVLLRRTKYEYGTIPPSMDEGKRVLGIMASILVTRYLDSADDLFGGPPGKPQNRQDGAGCPTWLCKMTRIRADLADSGRLLRAKCNSGSRRPQGHKFYAGLHAAGLTAEGAEGCLGNHGLINSESLENSKLMNSGITLKAKDPVPLRLGYYTSRTGSL